MAATAVGVEKKKKEIKDKIIKLYPMGRIAQKEAAMKKFPERKFETKALMESLQDEKAPMKKTRLEDSVRGKKMVFKKSGGRIGLKAGSKGCKLAKRGRGRAYGKNS